jgi:lipid-binding SYLF domain-containing protein
MVTFIIVSGFVVTSSRVYAQKLEKRVENCRAVVTEIMAVPDRGIPYELFAKSMAVAVFPGMVKGGFVWGGKYGKGVVAVRDEKTGKWSPPAFFSIGGGSWGLQVGVESVDVVLLIGTKRGLEGLLKSKVKLGGDVGVTAGPVGRRAEAGTDLLLKAGIFSYSRSKGLFAGLSVEGATVLQDGDANRAFYGKELSAEEILLESTVKPPPVAQELMKTLEELSERAREG